MTAVDGETYVCAGKSVAPSLPLILQSVREEFARHETAVMTVLTLAVEEYAGKKNDFTQGETVNYLRSAESVKLWKVKSSDDEAAFSEPSEPAQEVATEFTLGTQKPHRSRSSSNSSEKTSMPTFAQGTATEGTSTMQKQHRTRSTSQSSEKSHRFSMEIPTHMEIGKMRIRRGSLRSTEHLQYAPRGPLRESLREFIGGSLVEYFITGLILANAAMLGFHADYSVRHPTSDPPAFVRGADIFFAFVFTVELVLRIFAYGKAFVACNNPDIFWNILDTFLVIISLTEELIAYLIKDAPDVSSARMLRLPRLVRIVRVIRVIRFFRDLRMMILGIFSSFKPFLWALLLLALIMYVFSILFLQIVSSELAKPVHKSAADKVFYSSLPRAIYTLYMCISGGISWVEVAEPLIEIQPALAPFFTVYIAFSVFCVLNIVTGVFVERSTAMAMEDEENVLMAEVESRKKWMGEIESIFHDADKDHSGELQWEEFRDCLDDFRVQACIKKLGVDMHRMSPKQLWETLDYDNSGSLEIEEFSSGLQQLHGHARSIDLCRIRREQKTNTRKLNRIVRMCEDNFKSFEKVTLVMKQIMQMASAKIGVSDEGTDSEYMNI